MLRQDNTLIHEAKLSLAEHNCLLGVVNLMYPDYNIEYCYGVSRAI